MVVYAKQTRKIKAADYLLTSIFNQNYTNFKVVIVYDHTDQESLKNLKQAIIYSKTSKIDLIVN